MGFEPTCRLITDKTISSRSRCDHFDTSPWRRTLLARIKRRTLYYNIDRRAWQAFRRVFLFFLCAGLKAGRSVPLHGFGEAPGYGYEDFYPKKQGTRRKTGTSLIRIFWYSIRPVPGGLSNGMYTKPFAHPVFTAALRRRGAWDFSAGDRAGRLKRRLRCWRG